MSIQEGEVKVIIGESGSGKTTMARLVAPIEGNVCLDSV
nr:ATP-binding cassette domain-containing protein [Paenibacillus glacialis]